MGALRTKSFKGQTMIVTFDGLTGVLKAVSRQIGKNAREATIEVR